MSEDKRMETMNEDEWNNIYSGMGDPRKDKTASTSFSSHIRLTEKQLMLMYKGDGITSRIVDSPADASVSKWFKITNDIDNVVSKDLFEKDVKNHLSECLKWARLFGGGVVVMIINDGGDLETPVNENNISLVEGFHVYTRSEAIIQPGDYYKDPNTPKFGKPEYYTINPTIQFSMKDTQFRVHESRILRIDGHKLPARYQNELQGWGQSEIERIFTQIKNSGMIDNAIPKIITEKNVRVIKIKGYMNMIARNDTKTLQTRLDFMDLSMDQSNTLMIDAEEELSLLEQNISGLPDIIDRYNEKLCAVSRIPQSILFRSNKGLGSSGNDKLDEEMWQAFISDIQDKKLRSELNKLVYYTMKSKKGPTGGKEIQGWFIEFNPIKTVTQKEEIETRKTQSEIDKNYMDAGVYSNKDVANSRYGKGSYSYDTVVTQGSTMPTEKDEE